MVQSMNRLRLSWTGWVSGSVNRRIFRAVFVVGSLTMFTRVIGFFKEILLAYVFGIGSTLDIFYAALLLPTMGVNVLARALKGAFIPTYIRVREQQGRTAAQRLFESATLWATGVLVVIGLVLIGVAPYILPFLGAGSDPTDQMVAYWLFIILITTMITSGASMLWAAVLNANHQFGLEAASPGLVSLSMIAALLLAGHLWGIYALAVGMAIGFMLSAGVLGWRLKRLGYGIVPRWHGFSPELRQVMGQYVPKVGAAFLMGNTILVDQIMAAMAGPGSVSALNFGNRIVGLVVGVGGMAVGNAVLPYFSRMAAKSDWSGMRHILKSYMSLIILAAAPVTLFLLLLPETLITLLFQRGAFTADDAHMVAGVQAMYALQIPFYLSGRLFVQVISSFQESWFFVWGTAISFTLNIVLDYVFLQMFGLPGIALSTSVVAMVSWGLAMFFTYRLLHAREQQCQQGAVAYEV